MPLSITEICKNPTKAIKAHSFGQVLRHIRIKSGLTAAETARIAGLRYQCYTNIECQDHGLSIDTIRRLSLALGEIIWHICGYDTVKKAQAKLDELCKMSELYNIQESGQRHRMRSLRMYRVSQYYRPIKIN